METALTVLHYLICLFLIVVILLQVGKGADIGAAFGAGGSQTLFGPRGAATFLSKLTAVVAMLFLVTSLGLVAFSRARTGQSVFERVPAASTPTPVEQPPIETPPPVPPKEEK